MKTEFTCDTIAGAGDFTQKPPRSLLIVDDDDSVRQALCITFRECFHVSLADNGHTALEQFQQNPADVAILDVRMPGMNGLEVLKHLKELDPAVEVILLTAYESVETVREALRLGACDYLTKPFRVEELREAVSNAMERRAVSRKTRAYDNKLAVLQEEMHHQQIREELARTRNEIYASIIHDINGPLTVVAGYAEMMQHLVAHTHALNDDQLKQLSHYSQNIRRQVNNCIELSRRYLGFLEGKTNTLSKAAIKETFYDVAEMLKGHPQARANDLVIHFFEDDTCVPVHATDLLQVLVNITINALQCSSQRHRVEIYAKVLDANAPRNFQLPAEGTRFLAASGFNPRQALMAISVQDNGPGITPSVLDKMFEAYFTTKPPGQGTGLGLSIVKRLVFQAKGAIHVYSHLGEGTVFTIYFPIGT